MLKNILSTSTIKAVAGLSVGSMAADVVGGSKVSGFLPEQIQPYAGAIPLLLGVVLFSKGGMLGDIGDGMVANAGSSLLKSVLPSQVKDAVGISSNVMIQGYDTMMGEQVTSVVSGLGAVGPDVPQYDFTNAGEMKY